MTDWYWRIPAILLAEAHAAVSKASPTYMYEFAWRSPQLGGLFGAAHTVCFRYPRKSNGAASWAESAAWVSFASTGHTGWPKYDLRRRTTMRFDVVSTSLDDPQSLERELWQGMPPRVRQRPQSAEKIGSAIENPWNCGSSY
jgi:carboxylesterase type B